MLVISLLISSCTEGINNSKRGPTGDTKPSGGTGDTGTTGTTSGTQPANDVKDKTPSPPLQLIPAVAATAGWTRTLAPMPVNIPAALPKPNLILYSARKNIGGRNRTISVVFGDMLEEADAIVNAASQDLEGGGGIDGIIHHAAEVGGKDLMKEEAKAYKKLYNITSFPVGSAMVTNPYGLNKKIKMVVFTVGPRGATDPKKEREIYSAIYNSLQKASEYGAKSVSVPAVSTALFGFPLDVAAPLYFKAAAQFLADHPTSSIDDVRFIDILGPTVKGLAQAFLAIFP